MVRKTSNWISKAIRRPGALRAKAKKAGAITKSGQIDVDWLKKQAKGNSRTARQARLALTLRKLSKKR